MRTRMSHDFEISRSFENEYLVLRPGIVQNVLRAAGSAKKKDFAFEMTATL